MILSSPATSNCMYYPEKRNFITLIYNKFMFSLQKKIFVFALLSATCNSRSQCSTKDNSHFSFYLNLVYIFFQFVFYDWADLHVRPLFISDFPFFLPTQAKKLVDFRPHAIRNNWIMCISQTNGASIIFS